MPAPTFVATSNTTYASRTNTTVDKPSGTVDGDLILLFFLNGQSGSYGAAPTPPSGFTALSGTPTQVNGWSFYVSSWVYWKIASSEGASWTFTHSAITTQAVATAYRGVDTTTPFDATATLNSGGGTTRTWTGLTTVTADAMLVALGHDFADTTNNLTPPTGMTERLEVNPLVYAADAVQASPGATGDFSHTINNNSGESKWAAALLALRPASSSTVTGTMSASVPKITGSSAGALVGFPEIPTAASGRLLSNTQANTTTTRTFPNLSGLTKNSGDLLIAICVAYQTGTGTNAAFSGWTGGFTEFHDSATSTTMAIGMAYKWSTGSETGTFAVTQAGTVSGHAAMFVMSIPGAHATTPPEAGSRGSGNTAAVDPASFNPSGWDVENTLWIAVGASGETSTTGSYTGIDAGPANFDNYADTGISADTTGGVEAAVAFRQSAVASEDVGTFTVDRSNGRNAAVVVAVRSATSAPTTGTLSASVPRATSSAAGTVNTPAVLTNTIPRATSSAAGTVTVSAAMSASTLLTTASFAGTVNTPGTLSASTPRTTSTLTGAGIFNVSVPRATFNGAGTVSVAAAQSAAVPLTTASAAGTVSVSGAMTAAVPRITSSLSEAGKLDVSTPLLTSSSAGTVTVSGTLSASTPKATASSAGTVGLAGTLSAFAPLSVGALSGTVLVTGALSAALPLTTSSMDGDVTNSVEGELSATLSLASSSATGTVVVSGSLTASTPRASGAVAGTVSVPGSMTAALPRATGSASGTISQAGTLSAATPKTTATLSGAVTQTGALSGTTPSLAGTSSGTIRVTGELSAETPNLAAESAGTVSLDGTVSASLPVLHAAIAGMGTGLLDSVLPQVTGQMSGTVSLAGAISASTPDIVGSAAGTVSVAGELSESLPRLELTADGDVEVQVISGEMDATLSTTTASSSGTVSISGATATALRPLTASVSGSSAITATLVGVLSGLTYTAPGDIRLSGSLAGTLPLLRGTIRPGSGISGKIKLSTSGPEFATEIEDPERIVQTGVPGYTLTVTGPGYVLEDT